MTVDHTSPSNLNQNPSSGYFVGRQPILDIDQATYAYELLFRSSDLNQSEFVDGKLATQRVLNCVMNVMGLGALVGDSKAFVNMTPEILFESTYTILPADKVVIELLEDVVPSPELIHACKELKSQGYQLALDDFIDRDDYEELLQLADIVKVDFMGVPSLEQRASLTNRLKSYKVKLLAEKVETLQDARQARQLGYNYFQGYYYQKPTVVQAQGLSLSKQSSLRMLQVINDDQSTMSQIEAVIKSHPALTTRLLCYINSAFFGLRTKVTSISQCLKFMGITSIRKWGSLAAVEQLSENLPVELTRNCITRAMFCEKLGDHLSFDLNKLDLFMAGLLSLVDTLCGQPKAKILEQVAVNKHVAEAILGEAGPLTDVLYLAESCEKFLRSEIHLYADRLRLCRNRTMELHQQTVLEVSGLV